MRRDADEEVDLFRDAVRDATPLANRHRVPPPVRQRAARKVRIQSLDSSELGIPAAPIAPLASGPAFQVEADGGRAFGVNRKTLRALGSGRCSPQASLDLHRLTSPAARERLFRFLLDARTDGLRTVLVITGKGERARPTDDPIRERLRDLVPEWLSGPFASLVLAFAPARSEHGGAGALYVLLRSSTP